MAATRDLRPSCSAPLLPGKCRTCLDRGLETEVVTSKAFCQICLQGMAPGVCTHCAYINGEFDDKCRQCSLPLIDEALERTTQRKLKANASHEDAPANKAPATQEVSTPVPIDSDLDDNLERNSSNKTAANATESNDEGEMKDMMKNMMCMMGSLSQDVKEVKSTMVTTQALKLN